MKLTKHRPTPPYRWRAARGVGLLDAMIALAILAFGMLGMTRLQARMVSQGSETQSRMAAARLADELLSLALVDPTNAACYTLPQAGACGNSGAATRTSAWATRVTDALPGPATSTATINGDRFTVVITWTGKGSGDTRTLEVTTDVRP